MKHALPILFVLFLAAAGAVRAQEPPATITLTVPDYHVAKGMDVDIVTIPGGSLLCAEEGRPLVPYFYTDVEYPAGFRVQAVTMKRRSEPKSDSGIRLGFTQIDTAPLPERSKKLTPYPEKDFDWRTWYKPDGSTRLVVLVYPFRYEPKTTRVQFFKEYEFDVRYVKSDVRLGAVRLDSLVFDPGAEVRATVRVENRAPGAELTLAPEIRRAFDDRLVKALTTVKLSGDSAVVAWRSGKAAAGQYALVVRLQDKAGDELDRKKAEFRVGRPAGELTSFTAEPAHFKLGDTLRLALGFRNTGTCDVAGDFVFRIVRADSVKAEFTRPLAALKPGRSVTARGNFATGGLAKGAVYYAVGSAQFDGGASPPRSAMFSTNLMPKAAFQVTPETAKVGDKVRFDATDSKDQDGRIAGYKWEFDDGAVAADSVADHAFSQAGVYNVRLLVTDDEGGSDSLVKPVNVNE